MPTTASWDATRGTWRHRWPILPVFDDWWEPFTLGVGPAGSYIAKLDPEVREAIRDRCAARFGDGPFVMRVYAWAARGTA